MEVNKINDEAIILLILKIFMKIVTMAIVFMKKSAKTNKQNIIMEIVLVNNDAIIPTRASKGSAGLDLHSSIDVDIDINSIKN